MARLVQGVCVPKRRRSRQAWAGLGRRWPLLPLYAVVALGVPRPVEVWCKRSPNDRSRHSYGRLTTCSCPCGFRFVGRASAVHCAILLAAVAFAGIVGKVALVVYFGRQIQHFEGLTTLLALVVG